MAIGKTGKYFKYAIGEIILVVIGILIAIAINNWNENRKDLQKEQSINEDLQNEFSQNLGLVNAIIAEIESSEKSSLALMESMNKDIDIPTQQEMDRLIYWAIEHNPFNPSNSTYTEIMTTGKIGLIRNTKLKSSLFEWSRELEKNKSTYYIFEKWIEDGILPYLSKNIALKNIDVYGALAWDKPSEFDSGISSIMKDREFENVIDNNIYHILKIKGEYENIKRIIEDILEETKE